MTTDQENPAPVQEVTPEQELLDSSSAPTVLDLRTTLKNLLANASIKEFLADIEAEGGSTSSDDGSPQQPS